MVSSNSLSWYFLVSGSTFKCDPHNAKMKYFKSLNGNVSLPIVGGELTEG